MLGASSAAVLRCRFGLRRALPVAWCRRGLSAPSSAAAAAAGKADKDGRSSRYAFSLDAVTKRFPTGRTLFQNLCLAFYDGAKIGVLGVNGSGKSSFMRIIAGVDRDYDGKATAYPGYKVGYLPQEPELDDSKTVLDNVLDGVREKQDVLRRYDAISDEMAKDGADVSVLLTEQAALQDVIDRHGLWELQHRIDRAMHALSCPPASALASQLSGGERRRVALCRVLLSQPDILLLDEPTNHLDASSVAWLESFLSAYRGLVIAITHDRYFLDNVAGYILEIDAGQLYAHKGNYGSWLQWRERRLQNERKRNVVLEKTIARELQWLRQGQKGQQAKSKARVASYEALQAERRLRKQNKRAEGGALLIPEGPPLIEHTIIEVKDGVYWHDDKTSDEPLLRHVNLSIRRSDIVGIIGSNGCGKTTLLQLLVGDKSWKQGALSMARSVRLGYVNQRRQLDDDKVVWQEIVGTAESIRIEPGYAIAARAYVAQFNFSGSDQSKRVGALSGGERNRLHIAKALAAGCNVIVLDEPTNDLDVDTLRALEDAIGDWPGAAIIVSHDRWFLDRTCNRLVAIDHTGTLHLYDSWKQYEDACRTSSSTSSTAGQDNGSKFRSIAS